MVIPGPSLSLRRAHEITEVPDGFYEGRGSGLSVVFHRRNLSEFCGGDGPSSMAMGLVMLEGVRVNLVVAQPAQSSNQPQIQSSPVSRYLNQARPDGAPIKIRSPSFIGTTAR